MEESKNLIIRSSTEEFLTFKIQEGDKGIQVRYDKDTLWMTQKAMSELFDTGIDNINVSFCIKRNNSISLFLQCLLHKVHLISIYFTSKIMKCYTFHMIHHYFLCCFIIDFSDFTIYYNSKENEQS